jgi:hypothetical protein
MQKGIGGSKSASFSQAKKILECVLAFYYIQVSELVLASR